MTDQTTIRVGTCEICNQPSELVVSNTTLAAIRTWLALPYDRRPFIQKAFPWLSAGEREQLLTGTHEACFDAAFGGDE